MPSGILDLQDNNLYLRGNIINENNISRITSSETGGIIKPLSLVAGKA